MDGRDNTDVSTWPNSILQTTNAEPEPPLPSSKTYLPSEGRKSPIMMNSPSKTCSPTKTYSPSKTYSPTKSWSPSKTGFSLPQHSPSRSPACPQNAPRPVAGGRLTALARRQQQMQEWEDDYNYHSSGGGAQVATATHSASNDVVAPLIYDNSGPEPSKVKHANPQHFRSPHDFSPNKHPSRSAASPSGPATPTYHYGDFPPSSSKKHAIEHTIISSRTVSTDLDVAASANTASHKVLPTAASNQYRDLSPASKMFWDRKLISSLVSFSYFYPLAAVASSYI